MTTDKPTPPFPFWAFDPLTTVPGPALSTPATVRAMRDCARKVAEICRRQNIVLHTKSLQHDR